MDISPDVEARRFSWNTYSSGRPKAVLAEPGPGETTEASYCRRQVGSSSASRSEWRVWQGRLIPAGSPRAALHIATTAGLVYWVRTNITRCAPLVARAVSE